MPDFEEMYYTLMRASEEALRIMIEAQKECEEMYIARGRKRIRKGGQKAAFKRILQVCIYASFTFAARFLPYMMMPTR